MWIYFWNCNFRKYLCRWILPSYPVGSPKSTRLYFLCLHPTKLGTCGLSALLFFIFRHLSTSEGLPCSFSGKLVASLQALLARNKWSLLNYWIHGKQECYISWQIPFPETKYSNICSLECSWWPTLPIQHRRHSLQALYFFYTEKCQRNRYFN